MLAAGKYLNKQVNFDELADRAVTDRGLAVWYVNLLAKPPQPLAWRVRTRCVIAPARPPVLAPAENPGQGRRTAFLS